jgi:hypothetical protein
MKKNPVFQWLFVPAAIFLILSFSPSSEKIIQGRILASTNQGVLDAYVYVIPGEEETLSVKDGKFSLKTWQPLPLRIIVEHGDFEKKEIAITSYDKPVTVILNNRR